MAESALERFRGAFDDLQEYLEPLLKRDLTELQNQLTSAECVQLDALLAYTITSVQFMLLRVKGIDPKAHPLQQELDRVKLYMKKVSSKPALPQKRSMQVDSTAAKRIVSHYTAQPPLTLAQEKRRDREAAASSEPKGRSRHGRAYEAELDEEEEMDRLEAKRRRSRRSNDAAVGGKEKRKSKKERRRSEEEVDSSDDGEERRRDRESKKRRKDRRKSEKGEGSGSAKKAIKKEKKRLEKMRAMVARRSSEGGGGGRASASAARADADDPIVIDD
ncbi:unnamed protein product [Vitrella brassicaformis CCMP3155]|uniref:Nuclear nucleic acid-binding protein C1D n=1 Tax=Vitrella brassicaformis (strain CCMP3155) TaxID=1169540 RepID=A0A0G4ETD5_VITBC|nr:unnamed protein product [Vitrella brassicaformis CCMP3155]|eukprot:CEM01869.1 unnamed protein product [Vitrella brassicaformis CCMP3155]